MKEKGLVVMMVIAISVIAIDFGSSVYNVCAANITDHIYRFNYSGDGGDVATATRKKMIRPPMQRIHRIIVCI